MHDNSADITKWKDIDTWTSAGSIVNTAIVKTHITSALFGGKSLVFIKTKTNTAKPVEDIYSVDISASPAAWTEFVVPFDATASDVVDFAAGMISTAPDMGAGLFMLIQDGDTTYGAFSTMGYYSWNFIIQTPKYTTSLVVLPNNKGLTDCTLLVRKSGTTQPQRSRELEGTQSFRAQKTWEATFAVNGARNLDPETKKQTNVTVWARSSGGTIVSISLGSKFMGQIGCRVPNWTKPRLVLRK